MALGFDDPYGGQVGDVPLGQSKITPRETYAVEPRALQQNYHDNLNNKMALVEALGKFAGIVGDAEAQQRKQDLEQVPLLAAQVGNAIKSGEAVDVQLGRIMPEKSVLVRNGVAEELGKSAGLAQAQTIYENMPDDVRNDPAKTQAYFDSQLATVAAQHATQPFYGNAVVKAMKGVFNAGQAALSNQRNAKMSGILEQGSRREFQDTADSVARGETPQIATPTGGVGRPLASKIAPEGTAIVDGTHGNKIQSQVTPEGAALLRTITRSEANDRSPYTLQVGGKHFSNFDDHPRQFTANFGRGPSSASGAYQFTKTTWDEYAKKFGGQFEKGANGKIPFTPENQDRMAWLLAQDRYAGITGRSLQEDLKSPTQHQRVLKVLSNEWTSLPGGLEPNKATGGQGSALSRELAHAASKPVQVASASPNLDGVAAPTAKPDEAPTADATPAPADDGKKTYDFAGREEKLSPDAQRMRDSMFTVDRMQTFTHPTVANAQKRDHIVESIMAVANREGKAEWLKAIPNSVLTPEWREKLVKAEKDIAAANWTQFQHNLKLQEEQKKVDTHSWKNEAIVHAIKNPNEKLPPELIERAMKLNPDLVTEWETIRRTSVQSQINPNDEATNVQANEAKMIDIMARGGDPRDMAIKGVVTPEKYKHLLDFAGELVKTGGEMSNPYYTDSAGGWKSAAQNFWGFQYGIALPGGTKGNPQQQMIERDFQKNLALSISAYTSKNGSPINNNQRRDILDQALEETKKAHPPTNLGARVSGHGNIPTDALDPATQAAIDRASKKYGPLGK